MKTILPSITLFLLAASAVAQEMHPHKHEASEVLGVVNFTVSCKPQAQKQFNHAVAWLHSFEYEEAEKAFGEVMVTDPRCAMAYWGIAASNYHPLWAPPSAAELQKGLSAVQKAQALGASSPSGKRITLRPLKSFSKILTSSTIGRAPSLTAKR